MAPPRPRARGPQKSPATGSAAARCADSLSGIPAPVPGAVPGRPVRAWCRGRRSNQRCRASAKSPVERASRTPLLLTRAPSNRTGDTYINFETQSADRLRSTSRRWLRRSCRSGSRGPPRLPGHPPPVPEGRHRPHPRGYASPRQIAAAPASRHPYSAVHASAHEMKWSRAGADCGARYSRGVGSNVNTTVGTDRSVRHALRAGAKAPDGPGECRRQKCLWLRHSPDARAGVYKTAG